MIHRPLFALVGLALLFAATSWDTASAQIFTTHGVDTRHEAARTIGSLYGMIGRVRTHVLGTRKNGSTFVYVGGLATAFLVSPCHALTNAHAISAAIKNSRTGKLAPTMWQEIQFGPPTNGKPFRDSTHIHYMDKGQWFNHETESRAAYRKRYRPDPTLGLAEEFERRAATTFVIRESGDWALVKLDKCLGRTYGYFKLDPRGASFAPSHRTQLALAGHPLGTEKTIVTDNCTDKGPHHFDYNGNVNWMWSHEGVRLLDCTTLQGNSGSPVYYYDSSGHPRVIGIVAFGRTEHKSEKDLSGYHIPREYVDEYYNAWGGLQYFSGFIDIRQALSSSKVIQALAPYQPGLRGLARDTALQHYRNNVIHLYDDYSAEFQRKRVSAKLPKGILYLKLAQLNRKYGRIREANQLERLGVNSLKAKDWTTGVNPRGSAVDPEIMVDNFSLMIEAGDRIHVSRVRKFNHRDSRLTWALRAGNLAVARRDLDTITAMEARAPIKKTSQKVIYYARELVEYFSGNYRAAAKAAAEYRKLDCGTCEVKFDELRSLLSAYARNEPERVAEALSLIKPSEYRVTYRLNGETYVANRMAFAAFYGFRDQRGMEPLFVTHLGKRESYDHAKYDEKPIDRLIRLYAVTDPHRVAGALQAQLLTETHNGKPCGNAFRCMYYTLDHKEYVARHSKFDDFWNYRFGRNILALGIYAYTSEEFLMYGQYAEAIANADIELTLDPGDMKALFHRGQGQSGIGFVGIAIKTFDRVISRSAHTRYGSDKEFMASVYYHRGLAYHHWGKPRLALADYRRASQLAPKNERYRKRAQSP